MDELIDRPARAKRFSRRIVAEALLHNAPVSRADLARTTGLSKQTMSLVIAELERAGWVQAAGVATGGIGRNAVNYEVARNAAYSLGVDVGGTKVVAAIADLLGKIVAEAAEPTDPRGGRHILRQIRSLSDRLALENGLDASRIQSVVVGTPGVVDPATGALSLIPNISGLSEISVTRTLTEHFGQEVAIENDVNLAALGEAWQGGARGCENAAFLALGTGVGLGLIINGKLVRGSAGAAGEIAYLPIGAQTHSSDALAVGAFELEVGAAGILRRYRAIGTKPVATVQDVFAALAAGDEAANLVLDATAETIALAIAALQSILDAELVILGGGIGIRPELVTRVQARMSAVFAREVTIRASALGARASLVGAVSLAVRRLHSDQFGISDAPGEVTFPRGEPREGCGVTFDPALIERLKSALDTAGALALFRRAIAAPSVTGAEAAFAALLADELTTLGAEEVTVTDFAPGRPNVRGLLRGAAAGPRVLLTGHTDTVHVRGWAERWVATERENPYCGALVDKAIWGRGSGDLKAGICAAISAARLLRDAGVPLAGEILFAFVGDEESGEPGSGVSAGMKALVADIAADRAPRPDVAIYVEPTQLEIYAAQMGFLICEIAVTGRSAYFGVPELGVDALKASHAILSALFAHSAALEARFPHPLVGRPFVLVTALSGGGYIAVPGECRISLILKLTPGESLDEAVRGLEQAVRGAPVDPAIAIAFEYPAGRDHRFGGTPTETSPSLPFVRLLAESIKAVRPDRGEIEGAPYWSEAPFLIDQLGVPTVYCAPGDIRNCHTLEERVELQEYFDGIVAFAAFLARIGELERPGIQPADGRNLRGNRQ